MLAPTEGAEPGRVRIIDFGICRPYRDPTTLEHLPDKGTPRSVGTSSFVSLNVHLHHCESPDFSARATSPWLHRMLILSAAPSCRDDVESLSYTILSLIAGRLPWDSPNGLCISSRTVFTLKRQWTGARLVGLGDVSVFGELVDYARLLDYTEKPDYARWKERLRSLPVPNMLKDPLYDPSITSAATTMESGSPLSKVIADALQFPEEVYRSALALDEQGAEESRYLACQSILPPPSKPLSNLEGSDGLWRPTFTWDQAIPVADDELLGDEEEIVRARLDTLDGVPEGQEDHLSIYCREVMHPLRR